MGSSIIISTYFAFFLFPTIYNSHNDTFVRLYFQIEDKKTDSYIYHTNSPSFIKKYKDKISDKDFFYISVCQVIPFSQRPNCDISKNWQKISPIHVGCKKVINCNESTYRLHKKEKHLYYADLTPKLGKQFNIKDLDELSMENPISWGISAQWPIFFIALFMALKLGRALGEFIFLPYENMEHKRII